MRDNSLAHIWYGKERILKPVKRLPKQKMSELFGIDRQKDLLISNTKAFIEGKRVNNVLLWGERGTGKTTLIRALINYFEDSPLRIIQVLKTDIDTIPFLYDIIYEYEDLRFI
ncbi:MAG: DUF815 domain-containing protein, partial [Thermodesulfovibrio sp.]|nr:DUF815 domain-containing protein [Thermodesulfovibrio sp.]